MLMLIRVPTPVSEDKAELFKPDGVFWLRFLPIFLNHKIKVTAPNKNLQILEHEVANKIMSSSLKI